MFGKAKVLNSKLWKRQILEFESLKMHKIKEFHRLQTPNLNSNVRKSTNPKFFCLEKPKSSIPMIGKAQILNSNVWKSQNRQF